jgi:GNAT superfamily N-acetyltransferase
VITVRELRRSEVAYVDDHLPLSRLDEQSGEQSTYLVA